MGATAPASVQVGQSYTLNFNASDRDGNLSAIEVNWNDGTPVERKSVSGASGTVSFTRTFTEARTVNWSATAYDASAAASPSQRGTFTVTAQAAQPTNKAPVPDSFRAAAAAGIAAGRTDCTWGVLRLWSCHCLWRGLRAGSTGLLRLGARSRGPGRGGVTGLVWHHARQLSWSGVMYAAALSAVVAGALALIGIP